MNRLIFGLGLIAVLGCGASSPAPAPADVPAHEAAPAPEPSLSNDGPLLPPPAAQADPTMCTPEGGVHRDWVEAPCSETCTSSRIVQRRCESSRWQELPPIEPSCECKPESVPKALKDCVVVKVVLTPTELGASDGAKLTLSCDTKTFDIGCDGENDGTGTSLCTCYRDGQYLPMPGDPWPGEGIAVAYKAAERCVRAR